MTWVAYAAIVSWLAAITCFFKGAFEALDGMGWMFFAALAGVAALAFSLAAIFG